MINLNYQLVIPRELQPRFLPLAPNCLKNGHLGVNRCRGHSANATTSQTWRSPGARSCETARCARRNVPGSALSSLSFFPATESLMNIPMDLCGPFLTTQGGNRYLLMMADRFTKLMRATPLGNQTSQTVAKAFVRDCVTTSVPPPSVVSDNVKQSVARFLLDTYRIYGIQEIMNTTYHPQTNSQTKLYTRTLVGAVRTYCSDHPNSWDRYTDSVTYTYNTQVNETTVHATLYLVLSAPPHPMYPERGDTVKSSSRP